jgi:hypothetical protein
MQLIPYSIGGWVNSGIRRNGQVNQMKRLYFDILLSILLICVSCKNKSPAPVQDRSETPTQISEIILEREDSFSDLPNYEVTLRSDETAI